MKIAIIQNMSYVYKKNVEHDKNQKIIYFIFRFEASKVNELFKKLDYVTPMPFETFLSNNISKFPIFPTINETR